jgi:ECF sigma factor
VDESTPDVTALLRAWTAGDLEARDRAMALVYHELRRRAAAHLRRKRTGHTLQPTALGHEVYVRLVDQRDALISVSNDSGVRIDGGDERPLPDHEHRPAVTTSRRRAKLHDRLPEPMRTPTV